MTDEKKPRAKKNAPREDKTLKTAVLEAALAHVPAEGFTEA